MRGVLHMYLFCVRDNSRVRRVRVRVELAYEGQGRRGKSRTGSFLSSTILERRRRRRAGYGDAEGMRGYREMTFPIVLVIHWRNLDRITKTIGRMLLRGLPLIVFLLVQLRHRVIWWAPSFEFSPLISQWIRMLFPHIVRYIVAWIRKKYDFNFLYVSVFRYILETRQACMWYINY